MWQDGDHCYHQLPLLCTGGQASRVAPPSHLWLVLGMQTPALSGGRGRLSSPGRNARERGSLLKTGSLQLTPALAPVSISPVPISPPAYHRYSLTSTPIGSCVPMLTFMHNSHSHMHVHRGHARKCMDSHILHLHSRTWVNTHSHTKQSHTSPACTHPYVHPRACTHNLLFPTPGIATTQAELGLQLLPVLTIQHLEDPE